MTAIKTIDVKGLDHSEREGLVFPGIDSLKEGETLRIITDFNPVPLFYLLKAQEEKYKVDYEKEGQDEWILRVIRIDDREKKKQQFKELLTELSGDEVTPAARERAKALLGEVDVATLGAMEQELIREGVSHEEIRKSLCDIHLEAIRDNLVAKRIEVAAPHPVNTFMQEHVVILDNLKKLAGLVEKLKAADSYADIENELEELEEVAGELVEAESHHQREEEILFPQLEKHDIVEPPQMMALDHVEFRKRKQELYQLSRQWRERDFGEFKARAIELGEYLASELESHIFKEDNIIYQIALQVLSHEEWDRIKELCDKLGYCCFTPDDQVKEREKAAPQK